MLTCSLCAKMGHIKIDCHLKTQNSWVILVPKGQKIPIYLEAFKERPRKRKRIQNGAYFIQNIILKNEGGKRTTYNLIAVLD